MDTQNSVSPQVIWTTDNEKCFRDALVEFGHKMSDAEKELLECARLRNLTRMQEVLKRVPDVNINVYDSDNQSCLYIAIRHHDEAMVNCLLRRPNVQLHDALLVAIKVGNIRIVELLLDHQERSLNVVSTLQPRSEFSHHMSPLMLACFEENADIIKLLLVRGHRIYLPEQDIGAGQGDLQLALAMLDGYRALSSPPYLCISSGNPISTAFDLSQETKMRADVDAIFKDDYMKVSVRCQQFAADFLALCQTSDEVWLLLKNDDSRDASPPGCLFPCLQKAIKLQQKKFVTHPFCQLALRHIWTQFHPNLMLLSFLRLLIFLLPRILLFPFIHSSYIFFPRAKCFNLWSSPIFKFTADVFYYVIFLAVLLVATLSSSPNLNNNSPAMVLVWIFVCGYCWEIVTDVHKGFISKWTLYNAITYACFCVSLASSLANDDDVQREQLQWNSPILVAEAFFAIGLTLSFGKIFYFAQMASSVGPLLHGMAHVALVMVLMMCVAMVILVAFATGLSGLYVYYEGMQRTDGAGIVSTQPEFFTSWPSAFGSLFWSIFTSVESSNAQLVVGDTCDAFNCTTEHLLTEGTGYLLYGSFQMVIYFIWSFVSIAVAANAYNTYSKSATENWKFSRSMIWHHYFTNATFLRPPFNLIPSVNSIRKIIHWFSVKMQAQHKSDVAQCSFQFCCHVENRDHEKKKANNSRACQVLVKQLVNRYLSNTTQKKLQT